ncbi:MAG: hypothetical protein ABSE55_01495 [Terracidiphilus sp.]|jgi:uncharacterized protein YdcH (DUF465 family)
MGQFDTETDAALMQLNYEANSEAPGGEFAEIIGDLLMLVGTGGLWAVTGGISNLALKVRKLAGASYGSNLIYAITAVRNDLRTLFERHEELRESIKSLPANPTFAEAISALALRAMHTSVKDRLKRLARIVVNGVKEDDLEPESLDDMMRAATELKDRDISVLKALSEKQCTTGTFYPLTSHDGTLNRPREVWQALELDRFITLANQMEIRSSLERLKGVGFCAEIHTTDSNWLPRVLVTPLGEKFLLRLKEIAVQP